MNDRFKFKVWHIPTKTMHYNDFVITPTGFVAKLFQKHNFIMKFNQADLEFHKQCVILPSTGLKDRNGKDIYENDIIKNRETGVYYQIIWNDEATAFMAKSKNNTISTYVLFSDYQYQIEVYGNIYTTPERLKGDRE